MRNIYVLPTDKPSRLYHWEQKLRLGELTTAPKSLGMINQHIHITSDENVEFLDFYITKITDSRGERTDVGQRLDRENSDYSKCSKIVLTTDKTLIENGVQSIDGEFLKWFIKHSDCEYLELEKEHDDTVPYPKMRYCKPYKVIRNDEKV